MFEHTGILGGFRLVCPYHAVKKEEPKKSWVPIGVVGLASLITFALGIKYWNKRLAELNSREIVESAQNSDSDTLIEFTTVVKEKAVGTTEFSQNQSLLQGREGVIPVLGTVVSEDSAQGGSFPYPQITVGYSSTNFEAGATAPPSGAYSDVDSEGSQVLSVVSERLGSQSGRYLLVNNRPSGS